MLLLCVLPDLTAVPGSSHVKHQDASLGFLPLITTAQAPAAAAAAAAAGARQQQPGLIQPPPHALLHPNLKADRKYQRKPDFWITPVKSGFNTVRLHWSKTGICSVLTVG